MSHNTKFHTQAHSHSYIHTHSLFYQCTLCYTQTYTHSHCFRHLLFPLTLSHTKFQPHKLHTHSITPSLTHSETYHQVGLPTPRAQAHSHTRSLYDTLFSSHTFTSAHSVTHIFAQSFTHTLVFTHLSTFSVTHSFTHPFANKQTHTLSLMHLLILTLFDTQFQTTQSQTSALCAHFAHMHTDTQSLVVPQDVHWAALALLLLAEAQDEASEQWSDGTQLLLLAGGTKQSHFV